MTKRIDSEGILQDFGSGMVGGWFIPKVSATSRIWTRVADSIFYDDNRYAKHTSHLLGTSVNVQSRFSLI